jgi:hypothetical protein
MTELINIDNNDSELLEKQPELKNMLQSINQNLPEVQRATSNFGKRQSQFMDNMLTVSHPTPIRNMRQILSEVNRAWEALRESHFKTKKTEIEIKMKYRDAETESDELKRELLIIEAQELESGLQAGENYMSGAIRKIKNHTDNYNMLVAKVMEEQGVTEFSEIDFEGEEEKYHIMTAFSQGLNAAISKGSIDEGNQIYLQQLGINGYAAQLCVNGFMQMQQELLANGQEPNNDLVLKFLNDMAEKFKGCSTKMAEHKGIKLYNEAATIQPKLLERSDIDED